MEKSKGKVKLNDELLDKVSGGFSTDFIDPICPYCLGNPLLEPAGTDPTGRISYYKCAQCGYEQSEYCS